MRFTARRNAHASPFALALCWIANVAGNEHGNEGVFEWTLNTEGKQQRP